MRLDNKIVLITGASRGIGAAIATLFTQEGAKIILNYNKSEKNALLLVDKIEQKKGTIFPIKADISKVNEVKSMVQTTIEEFGRIDILINNAGITYRASFLDSTEDMWDEIMDVNLKGTYLCSKEVAPLMLNQGKGKIINIASVCGLAERISLGNTSYVVSKAGMIGLTRSLAINLGPHITVNAICPGWIETDMTATLSPEKKDKHINEAPLKRVGSPEEVAYTALFLASDESNFITGEIITVSGGIAMR
jgi:3-oxoacyl-[acyl-carrier protein] reductase